MRITFYLLLVFYGFQPLVAQITLTGRVVDAEDNQPLHFATIAVVDQPYGSLSQADGSFELRTPETLAPAALIVVSYLGYATVEYRLEDMLNGEKIALNTVGVGLKQVTVMAGEELSAIKLGHEERKAYSFFQTFNDQTYQLASRVRNPEQRSGVLTELKYYSGKAAKGGKNVRLNFYAVDPACDCPGEPLHTTSIIPERNKAKWNKVDLMPYQVELPAGDFFVAFEWLGAGTEKTGWLDFSIGMLALKDAPEIYEKLGGTAWAEATERKAYRPLVMLRAKVND